MQRTAAGLVLGVLLLVGQVPARGGDEERLLSRLDRRWVLLFWFNDLSAFKAALEETALVRTWREPAVRDWLRSIELEKHLDEGARETLGLGIAELLANLPREVVLGLTAEGKGGEERTVFLLLARLGKAREAAERILRHLRRKHNPLRLPQADGTAVERFGEETYLALSGGVLFLSNSRRAVVEALRGPLPPERRLTNSPRFRTALAHLQTRRPEALLFYLDWSQVRTRAEGEHPRAVFRRLGLDRLEAVGGSVRPLGGQFRVEVFFRWPGRTGLLSVLGDGARSLLQTVPAEAIGAAALKWKPATLYDLFAEAYAAAGGEEEFRKAVASANRTLELDIRRDIVGALGEDWVLYLLPSETPPSSYLPRFVTEITLTSRKGPETLINFLVTRLKSELSDPNLSFSVRYFRDRTPLGTVHTFWCVAPPFQLAVGVGEDRLVFGGRTADVKAALQRRGKPTKNFLHRPGVPQALNSVGGDGAMLAYFDLKPIITPAYQAYKELVMFLLPGILRSPEMVRYFALQPEAKVLTRHLAPEVLRAGVGDDGLSITGNSTVTAMLAPIPAVLLPALAKARKAARSVACANNLRQLGLAVFMYERDKKKMPSSLGDLLPYLENEQSLLRCPTTGLNYHLIDYSGRKLRELPPDAVLAYERSPAHNGRRNVLFTDGHVELMEEGRFQQLLKRIPPHLRAEEDRQPSEN